MIIRGNYSALGWTPTAPFALLPPMAEDVSDWLTAGDKDQSSVFTVRSLKETNVTSFDGSEIEFPSITRVIKIFFKDDLTERRADLIISPLMTRTDDLFELIRTCWDPQYHFTTAAQKISWKSQVPLSLSGITSAVFEAAARRG